MGTLHNLLANEGMTRDEFLEEYCLEDIVPGICTNPNCEEIYQYEPDQDQGYCERCCTQSVKSGLIMLGVI